MRYSKLFLLFTPFLLSHITYGNPTGGQPQFSETYLIQDTENGVVLDHEFLVDQGINYFDIDFYSNEPWVCRAQVRNVFVDGNALPEHAGRFYVEGNPNITNLVVRYFIPRNQGYCTLKVNGYRKSSLPEIPCSEDSGCVFDDSLDLNTLEHPTLSVAEFQVRQAIKKFNIQFSSKEPWICTANVHNAFADGRSLAGLSSIFYTDLNPNVDILTVDFFAPENFGYCSLTVKGYR